MDLISVRQQLLQYVDAFFIRAGGPLISLPFARSRNGGARNGSYL